MTTEMQIGQVKIGEAHPPFVIAELSGNHNQSLDRALELVDAAADCGAHAVKLQTYTADTLTLNATTKDFIINDPQSLWHGRRLYDLYQEAHTPWEWHAPLLARCRERGVLCISTPFDETAVDFLVELGIDALKIASFECTHIPLLRACAKTGKALILSTGMAIPEEIQQAINTLHSYTANSVALLKCTSAYPARPSDANLRTLADMRETYQVPVGISDHTMGIGVALAAVSLGGCIIEKHFTLRRSDGGVDSAFSMEPEELRLLVQESEKAWASLGIVRYGATDADKASLKFRQSLYTTKDIAEGEPFTRENVRVVRPGYGLPPTRLDEILGKKASKPIAFATALDDDMISES